MSSVLGDLLYPRGIFVQGPVAQGLLQVLMEMGRVLSQATSLFSVLSLLGVLHRAEVVILLVLTGVSALLGEQLTPGRTWVWIAGCQHSWENSFILVGKVWHRVRSRCR